MSNGEIRLGFKFDRVESIDALDLSSFIFDLNRIYVSVFKYVEAGGSLPSTAAIRSRYAARLPPPHKLYISRVVFESPGLLEFLWTYGAAVGAVWATIQVVRALVFWPAEWEKLRLDLDRIRRENAQRLAAIPIEPIFHTPVVMSAVRELRKNSLQPVDIWIDRSDRI
jgi:hypothetical protein